MKPHFLIIIVLLSFSIRSNGQKVQETEKYTIGFKISSIEKKGSNLYKATISFGKDAGIALDKKPTAYGMVRKDIPNHNHELGSGIWIEVRENEAIAEIKTTENEIIHVGDLLYTSTTVPKRLRTSYFYLVTEAISIVKDDGSPYYTFKEVLENDGYALRTAKFQSMAKGIREAGEKLKQSGDKTKVQAGPKEGRLVSEVMMEADSNDVWYYIYDLSNLSWDTMGQTYVLSESFRAYVEEGDAASPAWLKLLFVGFSEEEMTKRYSQYKRKINKKLLDGWKNTALDLRTAGKFEESERLLNTCIFLAGKIGDPYELGVYLFSKGELFDEQKLYQKSIEAFDVSLFNFTKAKSKYAMAYAYHNLGNDHQKLEQYVEAIKFYQLAIDTRIELCKENPDKTEYLDNLYTSTEAVASVAYLAKDWKGTIALYQSALQVARKAKNKSNEASMLWNLGYLYEEELKDHAAALPNNQGAASIYLELKDTTNAITQMRSVGIVYNNLGKISEAKKAITDGVALGRNYSNKNSVAYILEYQGLLLYENKEYANSAKSYAEAEAIYKKLDNSEKLLSVKKKLAKSLRDDKQYNESITKFSERLALTSDIATKADAEWDIAYVYGLKKDLKNEVQHYMNSEKLSMQIKDTTNASAVINNLVYTYRDANDSINSYKAAGRAVSLNKNRKDKFGRVYSYEHAAYAYKHFKNWGKAAEYFTTAKQIYKEIGNLVKAGNMADEIARCYSERKRFTEALAKFKESIEIYHESGDKREEAEAYWDVAYQQGQNLLRHDEAIANYRIAYGLYMQAADSVNASTMLSNIGQDYWSKKDYDKAIESHMAAVELAKKCRNKQQVASSWSKLATLYKESNNPIQATNALNNAVEALVAVNDSTQLGSTYGDLANSYSRAKDYPKALEFFNKSIAIRKALKDTLNWATAIYDMTNIYHTQNDYKNANQSYQQSLSLRRKIKDIDGMMYTLVGLGNLEENVANNYVKSEQYFLEAERLAKKSNNEYLLAYIYGQMKWLYRSQGKAALAESSIRKSLELYKKNNYVKDAANTLVSMSFDVSYVSGDQVKAGKLLDEAQLMADTLKDVALQAYIYSQRSTILREMGEFQKALEFSNQSYDLYKQVDNEWGIAGVFIDRGNIYKQMSDYDDGIKSQQSADSLYRKINAEYSRLAPLANIGENYAAQGNYAKAMEYYQQSLAIMTKANDLNENLAIIQALMGEANFYLGNFPEADRWLRQSLATCDQVGAMRPKTDNLSIMARLKIEEKKYDEARIYLNEGLKIAKEKSMRISYLNNLVLMGKLEVEKKNYAVAKPILEECIASSRAMNKYSTLWESLYWMGMMYKDTKELTLSRDQLKESVVIIEKIRNKVSGGEEARKLFSSDKNILKVYEELVSVLLQLGETDLAMSYLQKNNEDNLKAKYKGLDIKFQDDGKNKVIGQERSMKARLDGIEQQISNEKALPIQKQNVDKLKNLEGIQSIAEGDYLKFVNQQVNVQPELSKFFSNSVQPSEFRKRKKQIPKDMALLSYLPGEKQLYIFMATQDTVIAKVVNITREQLAKDVTGVMSIVRTQQGNFSKLDLSKEDQERNELVSDMKQTDKMMKPFEELYHYLVAPVASEIASKKKLCIIPNGSLSYIPFQLLGKTLQNGKFSLLANQFAIFYANSTDMLLRTLGGEEKNFNILAFGNPDKTLPSTEKEVSDIKKMFPNASIYTREDATEDKAKFAGENFNVMHFATHGNLDYEDFSKSYLTMAGNPSKNEDGKLTLEELWGMEVMNHLNIVVLSACQTAVTKGSNESSPVSPASGFLQNGVKSVVATLWKVDDEATSLLIGDFYNNIKTMDSVDALRAAQVKLSSNPKFSLPYYWAGAILLGDWR